MSSGAIVNFRHGRNNLHFLIYERIKFSHILVKSSIGNFILDLKFTDNNLFDKNKIYNVYIEILLLTFCIEHKLTLSVSIEKSTVHSHLATPPVI